MIIGSLKKLWNKYRTTVIIHCLEEGTEPASLSYWQNYLFASSVLYILPLSLIALIPGIYLAYTSGLHEMILVDLLAIGTVASAAFVPRISVFSRKLIFNGVLYLTSTAFLVYLGSLGPGLLYLLGITIFVVLSLEKVYGYITVALNTLICIGIGILIHEGYSGFGILNQYELGFWIAISSNLILLSAAAVLLIPILFDGLRAALSLESQLRSDLEKEQQWLKLLESAIANTSEAIAILGADLPGGIERKIIYVNDGFEKMTGYASNEVVGETINIFFRPDSNEQKRTHLLQALDERKSYETEFLNYKKNGEEYWLYVSFAPVQDIDGEFSHWVMVGRDVTERKNRVNQLHESLVEKETLLMEIHHRVKNNLAVVSSMMQLQALGENDISLQEKLYDSVVRIRTMSTIHELLYESRSFNKINFSENLEKLVTMIIETIQDGNKIHVEYRCDEIELNVNQAIPSSLIVNEVVTNAIKHAFTGSKKGRILLEVEEKQNQIRMRISDNGNGLPDDFDESNSSLGMQLIKVLAEQMNAEYIYSNAPQGGTVFDIQFKRNTAKKVGNTYL